MKEKIKKHSLIAVIIWLVFTLYFLVDFDFKNFDRAIFLGFNFVVFYFFIIWIFNLWKNFFRGGIKDDGRGDYGIKKEEINNYNKDKKDSG